MWCNFDSNFEIDGNLPDPDANKCKFVDCSLLISEVYFVPNAYKLQVLNSQLNKSSLRKAREIR